MVWSVSPLAYPGHVEVFRRGALDPFHLTLSHDAWQIFIQVKNLRLESSSRVWLDSDPYCLCKIFFWRVVLWVKKYHTHVFLKKLKKVHFHNLKKYCYSIEIYHLWISTDIFNNSVFLSHSKIYFVFLKFKIFVRFDFTDGRFPSKAIWMDLGRWHCIVERQVMTNTMVRSYIWRSIIFFNRRHKCFNEGS